MGLMEAGRTTANLIRSYGAGELRIGAAVHTTPICVGASLLAPLRTPQPLALDFDELAPLLEPKPELVIIGWAGGQFFLPAAQRAWFFERRIGVETMELGAACRTYNVLMQDGREVRALLFPNRPPSAGDDARL